MKIFICEFITSGGFINQSLPEALAKEGAMMMDCIIRDLTKIPGINIITTVDHRLKKQNFTHVNFIIEAGENPYIIWQDCFEQADACLIIAPETDQILFNLSCQAEKAGCMIMGSTKQAVELASSKIKTYESLNAANINIPETVELSALTKDPIFPCILKPDDGAGAEHCYLIDSSEQLKYFVSEAPKIDNWIIQRYISGQHLSLSLICYQGEALVLSVNEQILEFVDNKINLTSINVNELFSKFDDCKIIAQSIAQAISGLAGFVGVDCILSDDEIYIIEVNPRLTTSYCGLSKSIDYNPAAYLIELFQENKLPSLRHKKNVAHTVEI